MSQFRQQQTFWLHKPTAHHVCDHGRSGTEGTPCSPDACDYRPGFTLSSYPPPDARFPYGFLGWLRPRQDDGAPAFPLVSTVFDGTSQINDFTSRLMLGPDNYIRVNPQLDQTFSMDDCGAIPAMLAATERFMATNEWRLQSTRINELFGNPGAGGPAKLAN